MILPLNPFQHSLQLRRVTHKNLHHILYISFDVLYFIVKGNRQKPSIDVLYPYKYFKLGSNANVMTEPRILFYFFGVPCHMVFIISRGKEHIFAQRKTARVNLYPIMNPYRYVNKAEYSMQVA